MNTKKKQTGNQEGKQSPQITEGKPGGQNSGRPERTLTLAKKYMFCVNGIPHKFINPDDIDCRWLYETRDDSAPRLNCLVYLFAAHYDGEVWYRFFIRPPGNDKLIVLQHGDLENLDDNDVLELHSSELGNIRNFSAKMLR
jgi:hypothetical protein